jgi:hypothetical protein
MPNPPIRQQWVAVDFDETLTLKTADKKYPEIGEETPNAFKALRTIKSLGYKLILYTNREGQQLEDALAWCRERNFEFDGVNNNFDQLSWSSSRKVFAHVYIDDCGFGIPKRRFGDKIGIDWNIIEDRFKYGDGLE